MAFVKLTRVDREYGQLHPVWLVVDTIQPRLHDQPGAVVSSLGGQGMEVAESPDEVLAKLRMLACSNVVQP